MEFLSLSIYLSLSETDSKHGRAPDTEDIVVTLSVVDVVVVIQIVKKYGNWSARNQWDHREETAHVERTRQSANVGVRPERVRKGHRSKTNAGKSFENRFVQKHSKDALMRDAFDARRVERKRERKTTPPSADGAVADDSRWRRKRNGRSSGRGVLPGQQHPGGHWPSDYGGPMFLIPGLIIAMKIMKKEKEMLPAHVKVEMKRCRKITSTKMAALGCTSKDLDDVRFGVDVRRVAVFR